MKKKFSSFFLFLILSLVIFLPVSCKGKNPNPEPSPAKISAQTSPAAASKIEVVTTIPPIYDVARHIGGMYADVHNLLPPGASPHTYEPTPDDSRRVEEAAIVFKLGLGLDNWMDKIISSTAKKDRMIVTVSEGVPTIPIVSAEGESSHKVCSIDDPSCQPGNADPHIWMDPVNMKKIAKNVRDAYIKAMPENQIYFEKKFERYEKRLDWLDRKYSKILSRFKKKDFVTVHSFMNYLAKRYGLNQVAVISEFPGKEPDPQHIIEIVKLLKKKNVRIVFAEPQFPPKASQTIAREIGGRVDIIDPLGSTQGGRQGGYLWFMEENLDVLEKAFLTENRRK